MKVPVGKVDVVRMYPVSFREFLRSVDLKTFEYVESLERCVHLPSVVFNKLVTEYRRYLICGGMPEVAARMLEGEGMAAVESALQDILDLYEVDFSKYASPVEVKAEDNIAGRSLSVYTSKYSPTKRIRFSMNNLQENGGLFSIPNPLADWMTKMVLDFYLQFLKENFTFAPTEHKIFTL